MELGLIAGITFLVIEIIGMTLLMRYNLRILRETKQERLEVRRAYKKKRNEQLRRFYGLDKKD